MTTLNEQWPTTGKPLGLLEQGTMMPLPLDNIGTMICRDSGINDLHTQINELAFMQSLILVGVVFILIVLSRKK
jgi:hypothetical protein